MGFSHYWHRPLRLPQKAFNAAVAEARTVCAWLEEQGIQLAGPSGEDAPGFDKKHLAFNGSSHCGHPVNEAVCIPWPAKGAGGVASLGEDAIVGHWGHEITEILGTSPMAELRTRICNGDCSYESFWIDRVFDRSEATGKPWAKPDEHGRYFDFCKTAFRPYDVAVTAVLVIFKKHFGDDFVVSTDGKEEHWFDGKMACYFNLG